MKIDTYIGAQMRKRRRELKLTQTELGEKLGVTFQQIQKYEKGQNKISASKLHESSIKMNVPMNYFFDGSSEACLKNKNSSTLQEEAQEFEHYNASENRVTECDLIEIFSNIGNKKTKDKLLMFLKALSKS